MSDSAAPSNTGVAKGTPRFKFCANSITSASLNALISSFLPVLSLYTLSKNLRTSATLTSASSISVMRTPKPLAAQPKWTSRI